MGEVLITTDNFDAGVQIERLRSAGVGAIATFTGIVRDYADNRELIAMTIEHFPGMTEQEISVIIAEAKQRWPLQGVMVIHRTGRLLPLENIVFVGCASAHRKAAFESLAFIMDFLKTRAPFWKKEETRQGTNWVEACSSDDEALQKWN